MSADRTLSNNAAEPAAAQNVNTVASLVFIIKVSAAVQHVKTVASTLNSQHGNCIEVHGHFSVRF